MKLFILFFLTSFPLQASYKSKELIELINQYHLKAPSVGYAFALIKNGRIILDYYSGLQDKLTLKRVNSKTIFRLASLSKPITSLLSFKLQRLNYLDLNSNIRSTLPKLPPEHDYKLLDLLSSQAGIRSYKENDIVSELEQVPNAWSVVELFMHDPLKDKGLYSYSTHGYTILAAAIEKKMAQDYCDLLDSYLSSPFKLDSLKCEKRYISNPKRSKLYWYNESSSRFEYIIPDNLSWKYAGGGMEIKMEDFIKLNLSLQTQGHPLREEFLHMMSTSNTNAHYLGFDKLNDHLYFKHGTQMGARSFWAFDLKSNTSILYLGNTPDYEYTESFFELLMDKVFSES